MNHPDLIADADLCVKCGLCLPHCPTYGKTRDENESPRGRIALIQGWAQGALEATPELRRHVDRCLLCRSCEAACPAAVPYGRIVDRFRAATHASRAKPLATQLKTAGLRTLLNGRGASRLAETLAAGWAGSGLARMVEGIGILRGLSLAEFALGLPEPLADPPAAGFHPAVGTEIARVALFLGCTARLLDAVTLAAAVTLLTRLGAAVRIPETQTCCGALHWHGGDGTAAGVRIDQNLRAFKSEPGEAIVGFASGCAAMLRDYGELEGSSEAERFSRRVREISQFLGEIAWPEHIALRPLPATVCVHSPCSLRNMLRAERPVFGLLRRIPDLNIVPLPPQIRCCGAAGSYLLEHPKMAGTLRDDALEAILAANPRYLATSNPGCAMHLRAGLKQRGRGDIEVLHPVVLVARQLSD